jgi:hypothetical protein
MSELKECGTCVFVNVNISKEPCLRCNSKFNLWLGAKEISALQSEVTRLTDQRRWHQYIEGDTTTYPPYEDWYLITTENEDVLQEYYSFENGWATDKIIIGWAYQPEPVKGE